MDITARSLDPLAREQGLANYVIHDVEDGGEGVYPKYWGMAHYSGAYLIMKQTDASTYRFWTDREGYVAAWSVRGTLSYNYLFNLNLGD